MPAHCIVVGCKSRAGKYAKEKLRFFRLPSSNMRQVHKPLLQELSLLRRERWLTATRRNDLSESQLKYMRFCEKHFITRQPANVYDRDNPDWVPSVNMGYKTSLTRPEIRLQRHERLTARRHKQCLEELKGNLNVQVKTTSANNIMTNSSELADVFPVLREHLVPVGTLMGENTAIIPQKNPLDIDINIDTKPVPIVVQQPAVFKHLANSKGVTSTSLKEDPLSLVSCQYTVQNREGVTDTLSIPGVLIPLPKQEPPPPPTVDDDCEIFGKLVATKLKRFKTEYYKFKVKDVISKYLTRMAACDDKMNGQFKESVQSIKMTEHSYAMRS